MPDQSRRRLNDLAMHQLRRQAADPNITFIGGRSQTQVQVHENGHPRSKHLVLWIAQHAVVPSELRVRSAMLVEPESALDALLNGLVEAILPTISESLAPMMPGRIEVGDSDTADMLRAELMGLPIEIAVSSDTTLIDAMAAGLATRITPVPPWKIPASEVRALAASAVSLFHRDPWELLSDDLLVAVTVNRYGLDTVYFETTYGLDETEGIIAYLSLEDARWSNKISFLLEQLDEAGGEVSNVDQAPGEIDALVHVISHPENALGEAITIFYEPLEEMNDDSQSEIRRMKLPLVDHRAAPNIIRVSRAGQPTRPSLNEVRGLRLALDVYGQFLSRRREQIESEAWHFGPLVSAQTVKDGEAKVSLRVGITSPAPTFDPALRHRVLRLRVMLETDITVWREIDMLAEQPLWEMEHAIWQSFGWPLRPGSFLPADPLDGDDTAESLLIEHIVTSDKAPAGLMLRQPRDFCHYMFDPFEAAINHRVRLLSIEDKESGIEYPRFVRGHGEIPSIYTPEDYQSDSGEGPDADDE